MNKLWILIIRSVRILAYRLAWWLVAVWAILAVVLGTIAFESTSPENPLSTSFYSALQLLIFDSGAIDGSVSIMFEIARWLGAGVSVCALLKVIVTAFESQVEAMIVRALTEHTVICGAGERGHKLARDLLRDGCYVVIIDPLEDLHKHIDLMHPRLFLRNADASDIDVMKMVNITACKQMFIVGPNDSVNLSIVSEAVAAHRDKHRQSKLHCYVHLESDELFNLVVDNTPAGSLLEMKLFNLRYNAMRAFVQDTNLDRSVAKAPDGHFIVIGDSAIVDDLIFMLARTCFPEANEKLPVSVIGKNATARIDRFKELHPFIDKLLTLRGIDNHDIENAVISIIDRVQHPNSVAVIVANKSDTDSLRQYLVLKQCRQLEPRQFAIHQSSAREKRTMQLLEVNQPDSHADSPEVFGLFDDACDVMAVVLAELDDLAKQIHERYLNQKLSEGTVLGSTPAVKYWEKLTEQYREMNRRQADHIYVKCRLIGASVREQIRNDDDFAFTEEEVERLAIIEHRRWCAERYLNGWQYGERRDDLRKYHPDLVDWSNLKEEIRDYDRKPIRQIPSLLKSVKKTIRRHDNTA